MLDGQAAGDLVDPSREFAMDVLQGLSERPKRVSSRHFYDAKGSELFARIMDLQDYYPTRCERQILEAHAADIVAPLVQQPFDLVDLGAGDGRKTMILLAHLARLGAVVRYVPIDISEAAVADLTERIRDALPTIEVAGLVSEYTDGLRWMHAQPDARRSLVLFLGSNIGNFPMPQARAFLRRLWSSLADEDRVLIGFDLKKDIDVLLHAYNDREGVTAAFNLNLLERINRELGGEFDLTSFRHFGTYNVFSGAMESYLVSQVAQRVPIEALGMSFEFDAWEPIHTEYSYKYLPRHAGELAASTGFVVEATFHDARQWFCDGLWRVTGHPGASKLG